jgi:hypothetical protein
MMVTEANLMRFMARLRRRLEAGSEAYGSASFTRPANELVGEIQQELEDVCRLGRACSGSGSSACGTEWMPRARGGSDERA